MRIMRNENKTLAKRQVFNDRSSNDGVYHSHYQNTKGFLNVI